LSSETLSKDKLKAPPFRKREVAPSRGGGGFEGSNYRSVKQGLGIKQIVRNLRPACQQASSPFFRQVHNSFLYFLKR